MINFKHKLNNKMFDHVNIIFLKDSERLQVLSITYSITDIRLWLFFFVSYSEIYFRRITNKYVMKISFEHLYPRRKIMFYINI